MPDIKNQQDYQQYQNAVAEFIEREGLSFLSTGTDTIPEDEGGNPDPWFSWSPCEACGCSLGGNREYLFARNQSDEIVRFEICEDCVYHIEYGRLDDRTMSRVERESSK